MLPKTRKRKHQPRPHPAASNVQESGPEPDPALWVQAYEADIVRGPRAAAAAQSLEVQYSEDRSRIVRVGDALIRWKEAAALDVGDTADDEHFVLGRASGGDEQQHDDEGLEGIWVDRYDARLLLEALPSPAPHSALAGEPSSPTGWSDLPSDTEDTFFLSPEEIDDLHREKRRRLNERSREERLRALQDEHEEEKESDKWGGSDEEPDEQEKALMERTAGHLLSSPNSAQLEMRILANHGADPRFAFLRGRWSRAWRTVKTRLRVEKERSEATKAKSPSGGLFGGLSGYGDSDTDSESDESPTAPPLHDAGPSDATGDVASAIGQDTLADEEAQKARRARGKEWAEKRRAERASAPQRHS